MDGTRDDPRYLASANSPRNLDLPVVTPVKESSIQTRLTSTHSALFFGRYFAFTFLNRFYISRVVLRKSSTFAVFCSNTSFPRSPLKTNPGGILPTSILSTVRGLRPHPLPQFLLRFTVRLSHPLAAHLLCCCHAFFKRRGLLSIPVCTTWLLTSNSFFYHLRYILL